METPTVEELKTKMLGKLRNSGSGWYEKLRFFLNSSSFDQILRTLLEEYGLGYRLTPLMRNVFRSFEVTPWDKTRALIYTSQMNPHVDRFDGVAYSQSIIGKPDAALKEVFEELKGTYPEYSGSCDLSRWSEQGVLCIPHALSTTIDKRDAHVEVWSGFMSYLFDLLREEKPDIVVALIGESTHWRATQFSKKSTILKYKETGGNFPEPWNSGVFTEIGKKLPDIIW